MPSRFSFLLLPSDVREIILKYVLIYSCPLLVDSTSDSWHDQITYLGPYTTPSGNTIALLETCRTMYLEGAPIFYGRNTFLAGNAPALDHFRQVRTMTSLSYVRNLMILNDCYSVIAWHPGWYDFVPELHEDHEITLTLRNDIREKFLESLTHFSGLTHLTFQFDWSIKDGFVFDAIQALAERMPTLKSIAIERPDHTNWLKQGGPQHLTWLQRYAYQFDQIMMVETSSLLEEREQEAEQRNEHPEMIKYLAERVR